MEQEDPIRKSGDDTRAGVTHQGVRYVLAISLALVVILFIMLFVMRAL